MYEASLTRHSGPVQMMIKPLQRQETEPMNTLMTAVDLTIMSTELQAKHPGALSLY
jgi:hypothetical protein